MNQHLLLVASVRRRVKILLTAALGFISLSHLVLAQTSQTDSKVPQDTVKKTPAQNGCPGCDPTKVLPVTNDDLYYLFISHVGHEDDRIRKLEDAGQDASKVRFSYGPMIHISNDEVTQMLSVTLDGYHKIRTKQMEWRDAVRAYKEKYTTKQRREMAEQRSQTPKAANTPSYDMQTRAMVAETMNNLKSVLGGETYIKLEKWIVMEWGTHSTSFTTQTTITTTASSSAPTPTQDATGTKQQ